jgi:hypothetical protein
MAVATRHVARTVTLPAPVGGWNARDALANMPPTDAVYLVNWWCTPTSVNVRNGFSNFETGLPGQVETLMPYAGGTTDKFFAFSGTAIYDVTAGGAVGAAVVTGLSNARWQYSQISNSGGSYVLAVNGTDKLQGFNGTTWWKDGDGSHDITGVNTQLIAGINLFKNRLWLIDGSSLNAYYLPTNAIAGAVSAFPLQGVARQGGYLVAVTTWTIDAGYGMDDQLVFVTSKGELIVYGGTDPTSNTTFGLIGVWQLGAPVGRRCFQKYAGDVAMICQDGIVPLSAALNASRIDPQLALSYKIQYAASSAVQQYGSNFGWDITYFPKVNMLVVNVPVNTGALQQQYVMNTITRAWASFSGWAANCFCLWKDNLYFGGNTIVGKAWDTQADAGSNIQADGKQAFNYVGAPDVLKRFTMMRPYIATNGGTPGLQASINIDFDDSNPYLTANLTPTPNAGGLWGTGTWGTMQWGSTQVVQKQWQGVVGTGYSVAPRLKAVVNALTVQWMGIDLVFEPGGVL